MKEHQGGRVRLSEADTITFTAHIVRESPVLSAFAAHPAIKDVCHDLIGDDVRLYWDQSVYKKTEQAAGISLAPGQRLHVHRAAAVPDAVDPAGGRRRRERLPVDRAAACTSWAPCSTGSRASASSAWKSAPDAVCAPAKAGDIDRVLVAGSAPHRTEPEAQTPCARRTSCSTRRMERMRSPTTAAGFRRRTRSGSSRYSTADASAAHGTDDANSRIARGDGRTVQARRLPARARPADAHRAGRFGAAVDVAVATRKQRDTRKLEEKSLYEQSFIQCQYLWEDFPDIRGLTFHPRVGEVAAALTGAARVRLWHDQALYKEAGGRETEAHQDQPYWPIAERDTVTIWIPLGEVDERSGCMGYVPGSHLGDAEVHRHLQHARRRPAPAGEVREHPARIRALLARRRNLSQRLYGPHGEGEPVGSHAARLHRDLLPRWLYAHWYACTSIRRSHQHFHRQRHRRRCRPRSRGRSRTARFRRRGRGRIWARRSRSARASSASFRAADAP